VAKRSKFPKSRPDGQRYLLLLNDPETFARQADVTDSDQIAVMRSHAALTRTLMARRREIATGARKVMQLYREGDLDFQADVQGQIGTGGVRDTARMVQKLTAFLEVASIMRDTATGLTVKRSRAAREKMVELLTRLGVGPTGHIAICRLCDQAFYWSPRRRAQRFCPGCRGQWSPHQLTYRLQHKGALVRTRRKPHPRGGNRT
jgi:hypothetical protein